MLFLLLVKKLLVLRLILICLWVVLDILIKDLFEVNCIDKKKWFVEFLVNVMVLILVLYIFFKSCVCELVICNSFILGILIWLLFRK